MNLSALPPALLEYRSGYFALREELRCLENVHQVGAAEAEIFYAARILEVLSADALQAIPLPATSNAFANLNVLE